VVLRKNVIPGELFGVVVQECEFKGVRDDLGRGRVGSGVIRIA
jgi:hypothetical protein